MIRKRRHLSSHRFLYFSNGERKKASMSRVVASSANSTTAVVVPSSSMATKKPFNGPSKATNNNMRPVPARIPIRVKLRGDGAARHMDLDQKRNELYRWNEMLKRETEARWAQGGEGGSV